MQTSDIRFETEQILSTLSQSRTCLNFYKKYFPLILQCYFCGFLFCFLLSLTHPAAGRKVEFELYSIGVSVFKCFLSCFLFSLTHSIAGRKVEFELYSSGLLFLMFLLMHIIYNCRVLPFSLFLLKNCKYYTL